MTAIAPATISPRRPVPAHIPRPEYVDKDAPTPFTGSEVKDEETIAKMRVAGRLAAQALQLVGKHVEPGVCPGVCIACMAEAPKLNVC